MRASGFPSLRPSAPTNRLRLNRQPTDKAHARLRVGDVLTIALHGRVRVWKVASLAARRGPPAEARGLYEDLSEDGA